MKLRTVYFMWHHRYHYYLDYDGLGTFVGIIAIVAMIYVGYKLLESIIPSLMGFFTLTGTIFLMCIVACGVFVFLYFYDGTQDVSRDQKVTNFYYQYLRDSVEPASTVPFNMSNRDKEKINCDNAFGLIISNNKKPPYHKQVMFAGNNYKQRYYLTQYQCYEDEPTIGTHYNLNCVFQPAINYDDGQVHMGNGIEVTLQDLSPEEKDTVIQQAYSSQNDLSNLSLYNWNCHAHYVMPENSHSQEIFLSKEDEESLGGGNISVMSSVPDNNNIPVTAFPDSRTNPRGSYYLTDMYPIGSNILLTLTYINNTNHWATKKITLLGENDSKSVNYINKYFLLTQVQLRTILNN